MPLPPRIGGHGEKDDKGFEEAPIFTHDDPFDDCLEHDVDGFLKDLKPSKPHGPHQTMMRMDEISKQVTRMSMASISHLQDYRKKLQDKGIVDPHEQEEFLAKDKNSRRESFGIDKVAEQSKGGEYAWEVAEEHFIDDIGRSTMEEHFVKSVQPEAIDTHLLELLGAEGEAKLFLDYQRIVEYFRHKNALVDRKVGLKSMQSAIANDDGALKELSGWHAEGEGRKGPRKALKGTRGNEDDEDGNSATDSSRPTTANQSKDASSSTNDAQVPFSPPGTGRRTTLMGKRGGAGVRLKPLSVNTSSHQENQHENDIGRGSANNGDDSASHRSNNSTPTPTGGRNEEIDGGGGTARSKAYMRKNVGRLFKRARGFARSNTSSKLEVPNDDHHSDDKEPTSVRSAASTKFRRQVTNLSAEIRRSKGSINHGLDHESSAAVAEHALPKLVAVASASQSSSPDNPRDRKSVV